MTYSRISVCAILLAIATTFYANDSSAHGRWLLPSHTNLTGTNKHVVTFDMSISNELFQGHHGFVQASSLDDLRKAKATPASLDVLLPDGSWRRDIPFHWLNIKSSGADVIDTEGTSHYVLNQIDVYMVIFEDAEGKMGRRFGKPEQVVLPKDAKIVKTMRYMPTIHTFVSRNKLTQPGRLNKGLELVIKGHPNDLFVGEQVEFEVYFQGKPLNQDLEVQIVKGNTRYRNDRQQRDIELSDTSTFYHTFDQAGMYLIEAELKQPSDIDGIDLDRWAVFTTLEVNAE